MDFNVLTPKQLKKIADEYKLDDVDRSWKKNKLVGGIKKHLKIKDDGEIVRHSDSKDDIGYITGGAIVSHNENAVVNQLENNGQRENNPLAVNSLARAGPSTTIPNSSNNPANPVQRLATLAPSSGIPLDEAHKLYIEKVVGGYLRNIFSKEI